MRQCRTPPRQYHYSPAVTRRYYAANYREKRANQIRKASFHQKDASNEVFKAQTMVISASNEFQKASFHQQQGI